MVAKALLLGHHGSQCPAARADGWPSELDKYLHPGQSFTSVLPHFRWWERGKGREGGEGREEVQVPEGLFVDCFHFRCTVDIWWTFYEVLIELLEKRLSKIK